MFYIGSDQGAALTAEQILYEGREARTPSTACVEQTSSDLKHEADRAPGSTGSLAGPGGVAAKPSLSEELLADSAEVDSSHETVHVGKELGNIGPAGSTRRGDGFQAHGRYFRLSMAVSVAVAVAVSSSGVSTVGVISAAQVRASCCGPTADADLLSLTAILREERCPPAGVLRRRHVRATVYNAGDQWPAAAVRRHLPIADHQRPLLYANASICSFDDRQYVTLDTRRACGYCGVRFDGCSFC